MASMILVATPHAAFGELIRQSLEEVGPYQVDVALSQADAANRSQSAAYDLAILDSDISGGPFPQLVKEIAALIPGQRLVVIPPGNQPDPGALEEFTGLPIQAFLNKPFYLPDLIETIEKLLPRTPAPPLSKKQTAPVVHRAGVYNSPAPEWLLDPDRAGQQLEHYADQTTALAVLLARSGAQWAYTGSLPETSSREIVDNLVRSWDPYSGNDLARYVRLTTTGGQYMLYATCLAGDLVIAMVYEAGTPFSKIRSQAARLCRDLIEKAPDYAVSPMEAPVPTPSMPAEASVHSPASAPPGESDPDGPSENGEVYDLDHGWEEGVELLPLKLPPLLENVPPPDPEGSPLHAARLAEAAQPNVTAVQNSETAEAWVNELSGQPTDALAREDLVPTGTQPEASESEEPIHEPPAPATTSDEWVAETADTTTQAYTFILVPRSPSHYLTGEVARQLGEWMPRICLDFGWKLEALSVRPNFIQWCLQIPHDSTPDSAAKIIRLQTSRRLFEAFPPLQTESGSSTQFWAPGYLILSGVQTASAQLVREFIAQSRQKGVDGRL